jgi:hypothetical protein
MANTKVFFCILVRYTTFFFIQVSSARMLKTKIVFKGMVGNKKQGGSGRRQTLHNGSRTVAMEVILQRFEHAVFAQKSYFRFRL